MVKSRTKLYIYTISLPDGVNEAVLACADGYTIYIDESLDLEHRRKALIHAMQHIDNDDFYKSNVQEIEDEAHKR